MVTVTLKAQMPDDRLEEFLQLLRSWDDKKTDRHIEIAIDAPNAKCEDMLAIFRRLRPMFDDLVSLTRKP